MSVQPSSSSKRQQTERQPLLVWLILLAREIYDATHTVAANDAARARPTRFHSRVGIRQGTAKQFRLPSSLLRHSECRRLVCGERANAARGVAELLSHLRLGMSSAEDTAL